MTGWRMKLADWISGGELTFRQNGWDRCSSILAEVAQEYGDTEDKLEAARFSLKKAEQDADRLWIAIYALNAITDCETPSANATVRRMARIAREALE